jgi:CobW/HypB/UreG, nucleotide-binding domain
LGDQHAPALILVSGFLGAGKTTLILNAARMLTRMGRRVAVITNDQDSGLVDTKAAEASDFGTQEVAGGCFCCHFSDFIDSARQLAQYQPDIIFAEPVGSCIDLSATILQPLKSYYRGAWAVAPLTVLIDPELAERVFRGEADENVAYLFRHQIQEADIICSTKSDLHPLSPDFPVPIDFSLSAKTGDGVQRWLNEVLSGNRVAGARVLDVDYTRYADAEAALGWLNFQAELRLRRAQTPAQVAGPLLDELAQTLSVENITIAHLKVFDSTESGWVKAGVTRNGEDPSADGDLLAEPARKHELVINIRAIADPDRLDAIVRTAVQRIDGKVSLKHASAFRPAAPKPEHRILNVVRDVQQIRRSEL